MKMNVHAAIQGVGSASHCNINKIDDGKRLRYG